MNTQKLIEWLDEQIDESNKLCMKYNKEPSAVVIVLEAVKQKVQELGREER